MAEYIEFVPVGKSPTGKTFIWTVYTKGLGFVLGEVRWFGRWTKYAFYPANECVFEETCLWDIAAFCKEQTSAQRKAAAAARKKA